MTDIIIVGEDEVTKEIIKRLLQYSVNQYRIIREEPVRGGEIEKKAPKYNTLNLPVIILTDLDTYDCPPSLIEKWFEETPLNPSLIFRIAYGEAESWLMADRQGFSEFLKLMKIISRKSETLTGEILKILNRSFPINPAFI